MDMEAEEGEGNEDMNQESKEQRESKSNELNPKKKQLITYCISDTT